jgi:hypothetical protein
MKETIYTIPINEVFDTYCDCPLCKIEERLDAASIDYILGAALMEPSVRVMTNQLGFCGDHFDKLKNGTNRLGLALILESHTDGILNNLGKTPVAETCFICNRVSDQAQKYFKNIIFLYKTEPEFRDKFRRQEKFCMKHFEKLLIYAKKGLFGKMYREFEGDISSVVQKHLKALNQDLKTFIKSYDHTSDGKITDEEKISIERIIDFLS